MEDQQPAASDLTDETRAGNNHGRHAKTEPAEPQSSTTNGDADGAVEDDQAATAQPAADGGVDAAAARQPVGRWLVAVVVAAAALLVGSAAFAGAAVQPYLVDRATAAAKLDVVRTAVNAITTLWTYTPDDMDTLPDRAAKYLSGDFEAQYRKYIDAISATNKQAQVSNNTVVTGTGVESLDGPEATAIVYTNTTSTSPLNKDIPSLKFWSYRVVMRRDHARWLVTRMTTITSIDLTPRV